jgi:hypothetical protein
LKSITYVTYTEGIESTSALRRPMVKEHTVMKDPSENLDMLVVAGMMAFTCVVWFCMGIWLGWALWG